MLVEVSGVHEGVILENWIDVFEKDQFDYIENIFEYFDGDEEGRVEFKDDMVYRYGSDGELEWVYREKEEVENE